MVCFVRTLSFRKLFNSECKCVQIEEIHRVLFTIVERMKKTSKLCLLLLNFFNMAVNDFGAKCAGLAG